MECGTEGVILAQGNMEQSGYILLETHTFRGFVCLFALHLGSIRQVFTKIEAQCVMMLVAG